MTCAVLTTTPVSYTHLPTLALIVQREAEIDTFQPVPFYTVALELPGLTVSGAVSYTHLTQGLP